MYIFTFNINYKKQGETHILTEFPTILTNKSLSLITYEIRNIVKNHFPLLSQTHKIPIIDFRLGVSTIYVVNGFLTMHSFTINIKNLREMKDIIKKINEKY